MELQLNIDAIEYQNYLCPNNLKNWEFGQEVLRNCDSVRETISVRQEGSGKHNSEIKSRTVTDVVTDGVKHDFRFVCDPAKTIMVYGFSHCLFWEVMEGFRNNPGMERVYNYSITDPDTDEHDPLFYNPFGEPFLRLDKETRGSDGAYGRSITKDCKSALNTMIADNYKRREKNASAVLTPIIFCIDVDDNPFPITPESFCFEKTITHSELRRAYKLCTDPKIDSKIRNIACETFQFMHVKKISGVERVNNAYKVNRNYHLSPIPAPWEDEGVRAAWEQKQLEKKALIIAQKPYDWRNDFSQCVIC